MPFDDDELEEFYETIEARTRAAHARPAKKKREIPPVVFSCPTPEKIAYSSLAAVTGAALAVARSSRSSPSLRTYECRCGFWHLTSAVPRPPGRS